MAEYVMFAGVLMIVMAAPAIALLISAHFQMTSAFPVQTSMPVAATVISIAQRRAAADKIAAMVMMDGHSAAAAAQIKGRYLSQFDIA